MCEQFRVKLKVLRYYISYPERKVQLLDRRRYGGKLYEFKVQSDLA